MQCPESGAVVAITAAPDMLATDVTATAAADAAAGRRRTRCYRASAPRAAPLLVAVMASPLAVYGRPYEAQQNWARPSGTSSGAESAVPSGVAFGVVPVPAFGSVSGAMVPTYSTGHWVSRADGGGGLDGPTRARFGAAHPPDLDPPPWKVGKAAD